MLKKPPTIFVIFTALLITGICFMGCTSSTQEVKNLTPITTTTSNTAPPASTSMDNTGNVNALFYPGGWMGDIGDIKFDAKSTDSPHSGSDTIRIDYSGRGSANKNWAGIYWLYPDSNWGTNADGRNLQGYSRVTFWARGASGGEKAEFKVGGVTGKYPDSIKEPVSSGVVVLSKDWKQYTIDITGKDLSHVVGGFCWVTNNVQNPKGCTIYLDDMIYT